MVSSRDAVSESPCLGAFKLQTGRLHSKGFEDASVKDSEKLCFDFTSTRCVATVYMMLQQIYPERIGAATGRFLWFLVTDRVLSGCVARGLI